MIGNFPVAISIGDLVGSTAIQFAFIAAWASRSESGKYLEANSMDVDEMLLEDFIGSDSVEKLRGHILIQTLS